MYTHWPQFVPSNYVNPTSEDIKLHIIIIIIWSELLVFALQDCHTYQKLRTKTCIAFDTAVREEIYRHVENF